jgi:hypothetical protein
MDIQPALQVVLIGLGAAVLTELLGWLTVYRTASFRQRRNELNVASKRLEEFRQQQPGGGGGGASSSALTASPGGGAKKGENREKKEKRLEEAVKGAIAEFSSLKMKANLSAGLVNILAFRQISSTYEGVPGVLCVCCAVLCCAAAVLGLAGGCALARGLLCAQRGAHAMRVL